MGIRKFSMYDMEQFIREAGAERVTEDAVEGLEKEIEKLAEALANKAMRYAEHAGRRKLIRREDVLLTHQVSHTQANLTIHRSPANLRRNPSSTKIISRAHR